MARSSGPCWRSGGSGTRWTARDSTGSSCSSWADCSRSNWRCATSRRSPACTLPDAVIALVQVVGAYPALLWLAVFLRRREVARPAEPLPADVKSELAALGLSVRESEVIDLLLVGLSHKEVAERLFISPDTVKKHTYNAYRKLGVQNRVQLTYFVQNRVARGR